MTELFKGITRRLRLTSLRNYRWEDCVSSFLWVDIKKEIHYARSICAFRKTPYFPRRWSGRDRAIDVTGYDLPHAGCSGLAEAGVPCYGRSVASSGAANPPSAAGSRQKALPEVLRHKPVNYRVYAAAKSMPRIKGAFRRWWSNGVIIADGSSAQIAWLKSRGRRWRQLYTHLLVIQSRPLSRRDVGKKIKSLNLKCVSASALLTSRHFKCKSRIDYSIRSEYRPLTFPAR